MGGISIDENAETSVPGLFAAGEVCAGVHGANRLGGNALSEVFVMGGVAGERAARKALESDQPDLPEKEVLAEKKRLESLLSVEGVDLGEIRRDLKDVMWRKAGIIRDEEGLEAALEKNEEIVACLKQVRVRDYGELRKYLELKNMVLLSQMVCRAALLRTESRGAHYRTDYPEEDNDNWLKNILVRKQGKKMRLTAISVPSEALAFST
jgi:fumarate reductase (CoM/CoB) subunit A